MFYYRNILRISLERFIFTFYIPNAFYNTFGVNGPGKTVIGFVAWVNNTTEIENMFTSKMQIGFDFIFYFRFLRFMCLNKYFIAIIYCFL